MPLYITATPRNGGRPRALLDNPDTRAYANAMAATGQWDIRYPSIDGQLAVAIEHADRAIKALTSALEIDGVDDEATTIVRATIAALEGSATQLATIAQKAP